MSARRFSGCSDRVMDESDSDWEQLSQFSVSTANRFERREKYKNNEKWQGQAQKRTTVSTDSSYYIGNESFVQLTSDEKLDQIFAQLNRNFNKIQSVESKQIGCMRDIQRVTREMTATNGRIEKLEGVVNVQEERILTLTYRSIDIEARSRRNNLIFYNITERSAFRNDKQLILSFIEDELGIDTEDFCIERAHRLGSLGFVRNDGRRVSDPKRPLIVKFRDHIDTETVLNNAYRLRNQPFGVDRDFPREIADARKELYSCEQAKRARYERKTVQIRYPARLFIDGHLIDDRFPDWFNVMGKNRVKHMTRSTDSSLNKQRNAYVNSSKVPQTSRVVKSNELVINSEPTVSSGKRACHIDDQTVKRDVITKPSARDVIGESQLSCESGDDSDVIQPSACDVIGGIQRSCDSSASSRSKELTEDKTEQKNLPVNKSRETPRARTVSRSRNVNSKNTASVNKTQSTTDSQKLDSTVKPTVNPKMKKPSKNSTDDGVLTSRQPAPSLFSDINTVKTQKKKQVKGGGSKK